jgi:ketosteroid isomerase-like protein
MKIPLAVSLVGLALSFALPAFAQQKDTVDPQIRQQIDAFDKKIGEAYSKNDAAAVAALFTEDGVLVRPQGTVYGREAIEKLYVDTFQKVHLSNDITKADQNSPHSIGMAGNEIWETGEWSVTFQGQKGPPIQLKGYNAFVDIREGDDWKIRMQIFNVAPPPAATSTATPSPTATASSQ